MNTPKKADLSPQDIEALCTEHGIDPARVQHLAHVPPPEDYTHLTDVDLRKKLEPENGLFISESSKIIQRAHDAGMKFRSFFLNAHWLEPLAPVIAHHDVPIYVGSEADLEKVAGFRLHRGALASTQRPHLPSVAEVVRDASVVVIIEDLVDHTNVGAIFRSVAALGADAVLVTPRCADPLYRRAIRVSMGTVFQVPWTRIDPWPESIDTLQDAGFVVAGMTLGEGAITLDELVAEDYEKLALVFGSEGPGLTQATEQRLDRRVTIPMMGGVDSLNVAAASAIALYATRLRHKR